MPGAPPPGREHDGPQAANEWLASLRRLVRSRLFDPADAQRDAEPTRIGRYVVLRRVGQGGMGLVYAAYDEQLDRKVAVKLLRSDNTDASTAGRTRLLREAQALARLSHPSIIQIYEVGTFEGQVFLAMEFVDGDTLEVWQRAPQRTTQEILEAYVAAGRGLAAAHAAGIVHRDFKPTNVLVHRDGSVRVVDFGLARREHRFGDHRSGELRVLPHAESLTHTGAIMGTPAYMAPEQHLGAPTDARSDQFSYCVALYEALVGFRPFAGETLMALRANVLEGRPLAPAEFANVAPILLRALERGLQLVPDARYPTMSALLDDLDQREYGWRRTGFFALGIAAVIAVLAWRWWSDADERRVREEAEYLRAEFERLRARQAEDELHRSRSATLSQKWDDLVLTYAREVVDADPTGALAALKHLSPGNKGWLAAARTIAADAVQRGVTRWRIAADTGPIEHMVAADESPAVVFAGPRGIVARWSLDGPDVEPGPPLGTAVVDLDVSADGERVVAVGADGRVHLLSFDPPMLRSLELGESPATAVALSPEGQTLARGSGDGALEILGWDGVVEVRHVAHARAITELDYAPVGGLLVSAAADGTTIRWRAPSLEDPTKASLGAGVSSLFVDENGVAVVGDDSGRRSEWRARGDDGWRLIADDVHAVLAANPAGNTLVLSGADAVPEIVEGEERRALWGLSPGSSAGAITSGGLAVVAATDGTIEAVPLLLDAERRRAVDGTAHMPLTTRVTAVAASPVGEFVAVASAGGTVRLWTTAGEFRDVLGEHPHMMTHLQFSPSGHDLVGIDDSGALILWSAIDRETAARVLARGVQPGEPSWSPDSERVAVVHQQLTHWRIAIHPKDGSEPALLPLIESQPMMLRFSPDGAALVSDHHRGPWLWDLERLTGSPLQWPDDDVRNSRRALVFTADGAGVRVAGSDVEASDDDDDPSATLTVWHFDREGGRGHRLFREPGLSALQVGDDGRTLFMRSIEKGTLVWSLDDDRIHVLPAIAGSFTHMLVSPSRTAVLLFDALDPDARLVDLESGQSRRFPRPEGPAAWSPGGVLIDVPHRTGFRTWQDPTPDDCDRFLAWLHDTTNVVVSAADLH